MQICILQYVFLQMPLNTSYMYTESTCYPLFAALMFYLLLR